MALNTTPGDQDADSYVSVSDCAAYAAKKGLAFAASPIEPAEQAARRATTFLDNTYRIRFPGAATDVWQNLEWPRAGVIYRGEAYDETKIPQQIKDACCEAAIRELAKPGSLSPDRQRGGAIKEIKAGSVDITFADNAPIETTFTAIDGLLSGLLLPAKGKTSTSFVARA
ncbi:MAG: DnaT-like ssDNA-binding protein [Pseudaminobacter sp.]